MLLLVELLVTGLLLAGLLVTGLHLVELLVMVHPLLDLLGQALLQHPIRPLILHLEARPQARMVSLVRHPILHHQEAQRQADMVNLVRRPTLPPQEVPRILLPLAPLSTPVVLLILHPLERHHTLHPLVVPLILPLPGLSRLQAGPFILQLLDSTVRHLEVIRGGSKTRAIHRKLDCKVKQVQSRPSYSRLCR